MSGVANLTPYESKLTDAHFQTALTATLKPVLQTAKDATDILMNYSDTAAAHWCRDQGEIVGIEGQLPNIYQTIVMYVCGDIIDSLDPTVASNPTLALGKYGANTYRWPFTYAWSSTEYSSSAACSMYFHCGTEYSTKTNPYAVLPVSEL